ncbi:hypothetical protein HYR82_02870 [Candidatus Peregrinibacteria bacterium]|nr:hypothetical protein [Candidatus Peregrinibacteria bacterium]
MIPSRSTFGFENSDQPDIGLAGRERRLCRNLSQPPGRPLESIQRGTNRVREGLQDLTMSDAERTQRYRNDLIHRANDYRAAGDDFFRDTPLAKDNTVRRPLPDILKQPYEDRVSDYIRTSRQIIPEPVRFNPNHADLFGPEYQVSDRDYDKYVSDLRRAGGSIDFHPEQKRTFDETHALLFGENVSTIKPGEDDPDHARSRSLAQESVEAKFLRSPDGMKNLTDEYLAAARYVTKKFNDAGKPPPSEEDLRNPTFLLQHLPEGYLKGAILAAQYAAPGDPRVDQRMLKKLYGARSAAETQFAMAHREAKQQWLGVDKKFKESIKQQSRTFMDNYRSLPPAAQWGLAGFAAYQMIWGKGWMGKFMRTSGFALGGTWAYMRLVKGDEKAIDHIAEFIRKGVDLTVDKGIELGRKAKLVAPKEDRDYLTIMAKFLRDRECKDVVELSQGFATLATTKIGTIAAFFSPSRDGQTGKLVLDQHGKESPLALEIEGQIKKNQAGSMQDLIKHEHKIGAGVAELFAIIGAQRSENNRFIGAYADARRDTLPFQLFRNIRTQTTPGEFAQLTARGMEIAMTDYRDKSLVDIIRELMEPQLGRERDRAQHMEDISTLESRRAEFALYRKSKEAPTGGSLADLVAFVKDDYAEFARNMELMEIVDDTGLRYLVDGLFHTIMESRKPDGTPENLSSKLLAIEQLKYALVVAAFKKDQLPLTGSDVTNILKVQAESFSLGNFLTTVSSWINRNVTAITGNFGAVENLDSLEGFFASFRPFKDVSTINQHDFRLLKQEIANLKFHFKNELENPDYMAGQALGRLDAAAIARLGGDTAAKKFLVELYKNADYQRMIKESQKGLALKLAQEIVLAMITTHTKTGIHLRDADLAKRRFTPIEELNVIAMARQHYAQLVASGGALGMFAHVDAAQAVFAGFKPEDVNEEEEAAKNGKPGRKEAIASLQRIATVYLILLQSGTLTTENHDAMKTMVKTTHRKFLDLFGTKTILTQEEAAKREALLKMPTIKDGLPTLKNIYRLIVGEEPPEIPGVTVFPKEEEKKEEKAKEEGKKEEKAGGGNPPEQSGGGTPAETPGSGASPEQPGAGAPGGGMPGGGSPPEQPGGGAPAATVPGGGSPIEHPGGGRPSETPGGGRTPEQPGGGAPRENPGGSPPPEQPGGGVPNGRVNVPGGGAPAEQLGGGAPGVNGGGGISPEHQGGGNPPEQPGGGEPANGRRAQHPGGGNPVEQPGGGAPENGTSQHPGGGNPPEQPGGGEPR